MTIEETFSNLPQPVEVQSLKRGGVYALIYPGALSQHAVSNLRESLKWVEQRFGITFIVLQEGMRVAKIEEPKFLDEEVESAAAIHGSQDR
jgi:hypothetical protein